MGVERLDQYGEVRERAGKAIDLIDHDHIHPTLLHLGKEELQGWTLERSAGQSTIVVTL
jgi:hypothetical protein